jgi:hypothetical protein
MKTLIVYVRRMLRRCGFIHHPITEQLELPLPPTKRRRS